MKRSTAFGLVLAVVFSRGVVLAGEDTPPRPPPPPPAEPIDVPAPRVPGAGDIVTIKGRIVNDSGNPLLVDMGLEVRGTFPAGARRRRNDVHLAEDGTFTVENLLNGRNYEISFGTHQAMAWSAIVAAGEQDAVLHLTPKERMSGTIRGIVLNADGKPAGGGVRLRAGLARRGGCGTVCTGEYSSTRTREDGTFVMEFLGRYTFAIHACRSDAPRGDAPEEYEGRAHLVPEGSTGVVISLTPFGIPGESPAALRAYLSKRDESEPTPHEPAPSAITGRLRSARGSSPDGWFRIEGRREGNETEAPTFHPSPSGLFDTGTLDPGKWSLRVLSPSGLVVGEAKGVESGRRDLEIPLISRGTIEGRVVDPEGKPVGAGYPVSAQASDESTGTRPGTRSESVTREDGTFVVEYLDGDAFGVSAGTSRELSEIGRQLRSSPVTKGVPPGAVDIVLRLTRAVWAKGTLRNAAGAAAGRVEIRAHSMEPEVTYFCGTDERGNFSFRCIEAGRLRFSARLPVVAGGLQRLEGEKGAFIDLGEFDVPFEDLELRLPKE